jgi:NifB/MoaA-like Fe-S oxidoreductase
MSFTCWLNLPWPKAEEYEAFYQLENGVGMLASFERDFMKYIE